MRWQPCFFEQLLGVGLRHVAVDDVSCGAGVLAQRGGKRRVLLDRDELRRASISRSVRAPRPGPTSITASFGVRRGGVTMRLNDGHVGEEMLAERLVGRDALSRSSRGMKGARLSRRVAACYGARM